MAERVFPVPELVVHLGDRAGLDAAAALLVAAQQRVELARARREVHHVLALRVLHRRGLEGHVVEHLERLLVELLHLRLGDPLDPRQLLLRRLRHRLDRVVARLLELLDVGRRDAADLVERLDHVVRRLPALLALFLRDVLHGGLLLLIVEANVAAVAQPLLSDGGDAAAAISLGVKANLPSHADAGDPADADQRRRASPTP